MNPSGPTRLTLHQIVMLVLSVYVVLALLIRELISLDEGVHALLDWVDTGICLYFLYDFFLQFYQAPNKRLFMRWGWIDLLASIPAFSWGVWVSWSALSASCG